MSCGYVVVAAVTVLATAAYVVVRGLVLRIEDRLDDLRQIVRRAAVDAANAHVRCDGITARLSRVVDRHEGLEARVATLEVR